MGAKKSFLRWLCIVMSDMMYSVHRHTLVLRISQLEVIGLIYIILAQERNFCIHLSICVRLPPRSAKRGFSWHSRHLHLASILEL